MRLGFTTCQNLSRVFACESANDLDNWTAAPGLLSIMDITISPLAEPDIPALLGLIRELAEYEQLSHRVSATEDSLRRDLLGPHPCAEVLIGRMNGLVAGYAVFFHSYSTFMAKRGIYLEDVFVRASARGQGVGKALFRGVAEAARMRECGRLEFSVLDWNQPSIDFYIARGAEPLSDWTMYRLNEEAIATVAAGEKM